MKPEVTAIFDDLNAYRNFCVQFGRRFDERALYNVNDSNWQDYQQFKDFDRSQMNKRNGNNSYNNNNNNNQRRNNNYNGPKRNFKTFTKEKR
jgi:hypothetical protein